MPTNAGVVVLGLNELQARLARGRGEEANKVRTVVRSIAQIVVEETIPLMESQFVSHGRMDQQLETSLRTSVTNQASRGISAKIIEGRGGGEQSSGMYAGVWEFGGYPAGYPYKSGGRALLPTVKKNREKLIAAIETAMQELAKMIEG